jgi:hypothetical protein
MNINQTLKFVEKTIGSAKFAVVIILVFAGYLTYGTFQESYHGTEYANRLVYKSSFFMAVQFLMFLSIFMATLQRLPFNRRLAGFYTLHLGLLLLFIGSFVTFYAGIDGSLNLPPNTPNNEIVINEDELYVKNLTNNNELIYPMPFTAGPKLIGEKFNDVELLTYIPFADDQIEWKYQKGNDYHSSQYFLTNQRMSQKLTLSLNPTSPFQSSERLGPLSVYYLPNYLAPCFEEAKNERFVLWNMIDKSCIKSFKVENKKTNTFEVVLITYEKIKTAFIPKSGPLPITITKQSTQIEYDRFSPLRIFDKSLFEESPNIFLFGKSITYYENAQGWQHHNLNVQDPLALPWMGFELNLLKHSEETYPVTTPKAVLPIEEMGEKIQGAVRAIELGFNEGNTVKKFWIKKDKPEKITVDGKQFYVSLRNKTLKMPFELTLENFKMDTDPGTNNPASYESFLNLFEQGQSAKHHVYMNNPLKYKKMTFYQASYFQTSSGGPYGSVLSVNFDPGRWLKYLGSILLVLGSLWHFVLRKKLVSLTPQKGSV